MYSQQVRVSALMCASRDFETINGFIGRSWSVPLNSNLYEINVRVGPPPQRA